MNELVLLPLTKRQREVLTFLTVRIAADGYAPSLEEIGRHFGLTSLATIHKHLTNLDRKGYITRRWNHARSVVIHERGPVCPLCGHQIREELLSGVPAPVIEPSPEADGLAPARGSAPS